MATAAVALPVAVNVSGGIKTEDGRILFGMDAETYLKMKAKEDPQYERKVGDWIEQVLGEDLIDKGDLYTSLRDGIMLCKLLNKIKENIVPRCNTKLFRGKLHPLSERENITVYLEACWKLGLAASDIFVVSDLHGRQGMAAVLNNITALSQIAPNFGVTVPPIGPKKIDLAQKKAPKFEVNVIHGSVFVGEVEDDDVEEIEEELRQVTLKLEEAQRTIKQLETSKQNLNELLNIEKRQHSEAEKEAKILRSAQGPSADEEFVEELKRSREKLISEIEDIRRRINAEPEVQLLKKEIIDTRERVVKNALEKESMQMAEAEEAAKKLKEQREEEAKKLREKISQLEKKSQELNSNYEEEKSQLNEKLMTAQKEHDKLKIATEDVEKKRQRLEEINENLKKLLDEYTQKSQKIESDFQISQLTAQEDSKTLLEGIELIEKEKTENSSKFVEIQQQLENEIRLYKAENVKDLSKLNSTINQISSEKNIIEQELAAAKEKLAQTIVSAKSSSAVELDKIQEKIKQVEDEIKQLSENYSAEQAAFEEELFNLYVQSTTMTETYEEEIQKLRKEKNEISEQNFSTFQKKTRELFDRENELKKEVDTIKIQIDSRSAIVALFKSSQSDISEDISILKNEIDSLKSEKNMLEKQHDQQREQLMKIYAELQEKIDRQIQAEKTKREELDNFYKTQKSKLEFEIQNNSAKQLEETNTLTETVQKLENENKQLEDSERTILEEINEEITRIKANSARTNTQLQNKISEISAEKANILEDREKIHQNLQEQIQELKIRFEKEHNKLDQKFSVLSEENQSLSQKLKDAQNARDLVVNSQNQQQNSFGSELQQLKSMFTTALDQLTTNNGELSKEKISLEREIENVKKNSTESEKRWKIEEAELRVQIIKSINQKSHLEKDIKAGNLRGMPPAAEKKIKELELKLMMAETEGKTEINKLKKKLEEEGPEEEFMERIKELKKEIEQQKELIEKLNKEIEASTKKTAPPTSSQTPPQTTAPNPALSTIDIRKHRRTMRFVPMEPPPSVDKDLEKLRDVMLKIMSGEYVSDQNDLAIFARLFKLDQGRRIFTFLLKEYAESPEDDSPLLITPNSFNQLKKLIELVLDTIDLRTGGDFINGKILLETSSMIGVEVKGGEPEFIQEIIKSHRCWQNTFFWQEYFWAQSTPKFNESFGESSNSSQEWSEKENKFWEIEIIAFAKVMYNWGDLPLGKLLLFVESLTDATGLGLQSRTLVVKAVQDFHLKEVQRLKSGYRKSRMFSVSSGTTEGGRQAASKKPTRVIRTMRGNNNKTESPTQVPSVTPTPSTTTPSITTTSPSTSTPSPSTTTPSTTTPPSQGLPVRGSWTRGPSRPVVKNATQGKPGEELPPIRESQHHNLSRRIAARSIVVNAEVTDFIQRLRGTSIANTNNT